MELATQIKQHRSRMGWSQEDLAEKAFVSRQTISNWENEKSYPDIQSLLLLSTLFGVSLDQLVKGDVEIMKQETQENDVKQFKRMSQFLLIGALIMGVSGYPLFTLFGAAGVGIWAVIFAITMLYGIHIERWKKERHLNTYREILAFMNGVPIDEIRHERSGKKEVILKLLAGALAGLLCALLSVYIVQHI